MCVYVSIFYSICIKKTDTRKEGNLSYTFGLLENLLLKIYFTMYTCYLFQKHNKIKWQGIRRNKSYLYSTSWFTKHFYLHCFLWRSPQRWQHQSREVACPLPKVTPCQFPHMLPLLVSHSQINYCLHHFNFVLFNRKLPISSSGQ